MKLFLTDFSKHAFPFFEDAKMHVLVVRHMTKGFSEPFLVHDNRMFAERAFYCLYRKGTDMNILFFLNPKAETAYVYDYCTLRQVLETMEYHKYSCIPMLNREGEYVGTITEGDLLWGIKSRTSLNIKEAEKIFITDFPRRADYEAVDADCDMEDLIQKAMNQNFVPVVDDQKKFIGIITRKSIIDYCYKRLKEYSERENEA